MQSLVSIIIPCYNSASFVIETLDSVFTQTYKNIEVIVVNDGSKDNLEDVIGSYIKGNLIIYLKQENGGVSKARNNGARYANGKYFVFLDSDDLIAPTYIEKCVDILDRSPDIKVVYTHRLNIGAVECKVKVPEYSFGLLLLENFIPTGAVLRKDDFDKVRGFDESLKYYEDWDLWIKLLKDNGSAQLFSEYLFFYRIHSDKSSLTDFVKANPEFDRTYNQILFQKHKDVYIKELGTEVDMLRIIADQSRQIERQKRKLAKWYRKLFRF